MFINLSNYPDDLDIPDNNIFDEEDICKKYNKENPFVNPKFEDIPKIQSVLQEAKIMANLLESNHPRAKELYKFVTLNEENRKWFLENQENIKLIEEGGEFFLEILGDKFYLKDEVTEEGKGINNLFFTYFNSQAMLDYIIKSQGKDIPDWYKILEFLPGDPENKNNFFKNVLELKDAGYYDSYNSEPTNVTTEGYYYSSTDIFAMEERKFAGTITTLLPFVYPEVKIDDLNVNLLNDKNSITNIKRGTILSLNSLSLSKINGKDGYVLRCIKK